MAYADLTAEEKNILHNYVRNVRAWCGEQARTNNHGEALNDDYNAQVSALLSQVGAAEAIPDGSGLAGAASLTGAEVTTLTAHLQNMQTDMSTHTGGFNTTAIRQTWTKAAGVTNMIG